MAKDEQNFRSNRLKFTTTFWLGETPPGFKDTPVDSVGIGSIVNLSDQETGTRKNSNVLGAWDIIPDNDIISYLTRLDKNCWVNK